MLKETHPTVAFLLFISKTTEKAGAFDSWHASAGISFHSSVSQWLLWGKTISFVLL